MVVSSSHSFPLQEARTIHKRSCVIYGSLNVKAVKSGKYTLPSCLDGRILFRVSSLLVSLFSRVNFLEQNYGEEDHTKIVPIVCGRKSLCYCKNA